MEVSAPPGNVIGTIEQEWSIFPKFKVKDESGDVVLKIEGPFFPCSCCGTDVNFEVKIKNEWTTQDIYHVRLYVYRYFHVMELKKWEKFPSNGLES